MDKFLISSTRLINTHGVLLNYAVVVPGVYNVETSTSAAVKTNYSVKIYPKQVIATSYNFPALIGKEVYMFYLANNALTFVPSLNDEITYNGKIFLVQSYQETVTQGNIVLYRILASKG